MSKPAVAAMVIQLKKGRDGPASLACVRADGRVRTLRDDLVGHWLALAPGETLEVRRVRC